MLGLGWFELVVDLCVLRSHGLCELVYQSRWVQKVLCPNPNQKFKCNW